jgi:hypothetical protein
MGGIEYSPGKTYHCPGNNEYSLGVLKTVQAVLFIKVQAVLSTVQAVNYTVWTVLSTIQDKSKVKNLKIKLLLWYGNITITCLKA